MVSRLTTRPQFLSSSSSRLNSRGVRFSSSEPRVTRRVADGFEMLAIRSRKRVPQLLAEALDLLEERYGKVG